MQDCETKQKFNIYQRGHPHINSGQVTVATIDYFFSISRVEKNAAFCEHKFGGKRKSKKCKQDMFRYIAKLLLIYQFFEFEFTIIKIDWNLCLGHFHAAK